MFLSKEPMDLSLIAKRVEDGLYTSREAFVKDFKRMVENCAFYNGLQSGTNKTLEFSIPIDHTA